MWVFGWTSFCHLMLLVDVDMYQEEPVEYILLVKGAVYCSRIPVFFVSESFRRAEWDLFANLYPLHTKCCIVFSTNPSFHLQCLSGHQPAMIYRPQKSSCFKRVEASWSQTSGPSAAVKMRDTPTLTPLQSETLALPKPLTGAGDGLQDSSAIWGEELGSIDENLLGQQGRALEQGTRKRAGMM
jgi:hypothetical protein